MRAHEFLRVAAAAAPLVAAGPSSAQMAKMAQAPQDTTSRFRFASTHIGLDVLGVPSGSAPVLMAGAVDPFAVDVPAQGVARFTIGGLHFWGRADFYVAIPLRGVEASAEVPASVDIENRLGIEVGARAFAVPLRPGRVSPYAGIAFTSGSYEQSRAETSGPELDYRRLALQAGVAWMNRLGSLEAGVQFLPSSSLDYPLSRTRSTTIDLPAIGAWIGFKRHTDATLDNERRRASGELVRAELRLAERSALSGFTVQAGVTTAFTASTSSYNVEARPFLGTRLPPATGPDIGLGYYFHDIDAAVNVSFRRFVQRQNAFGVEQEGRRTAAGIEAIKFLGDYHGFVPFVGPVLGFEATAVEEWDNGVQVTSVERTTWRPGIVAGWDIRPTRSGWFVLRTNLRYTPGSRVETASGQHVAFDHVEVDFIQLVLYPQRLLAR